MARAPEVGKVKMRLAAAIGAERACMLYRAFVRDLDARFAGGKRELVWAYTLADADFSALVRPGSRCLPQRGGDLGERMLRCFADVFAAGFARAIMIGADVPHVRDEWLEEAEAHLDDADIVLGPSDDGGYYLAPHNIFSGVTMSTALVLQQTLARAEILGLRVHLLPRSFDIDEPDDLDRLRAEIDRNPHALTETAAILGELPIVTHGLQR